MKNKSYQILIFIFVAFPLLISAQEVGGLQQDTLFEKISLEDLEKIKDYYDRKVEKLREEEQASLVEGKELGESFLSDQAFRIEDRDKIYIRIAEYYIEQADRDFEEANYEFDDLFDVYEEKLTQFQNGQISEEPDPPQSPKYDYSQAISIYDKLLEEYPSSEYADDALYSKAWLKEQMRQSAESRRLFQEVIDKYPDSHFAAESYMQLAEYFFNPREDKTDDEQTVLELRKAIQLYKKVLSYRDSKRYDEALYKLGWSYYKLASRDAAYYNDAITYFMAVVDDIERAKKLDPTGKITVPDVRNEAIQYIGISFTDEAYTVRGVDKARNTIERVGDIPYGVEIMRAIGDTYQKIDEQDKAIYAFTNLLEMYPKYEEAPLVQENISKAIFAKGQDRLAYEEREKLYKLYNPNSEWYSFIENSEVEDKVTHLNSAYTKSEEAFRTNLLFDLEAAQATEAEGTDARGQWENFVLKCQEYIEIFPSDSNTYEIHWNYALALDQKLGRFDEAFEEYLTVSNDYLEEQYQHQASLYAVGVADTIVALKYGSEDDTVKISLADIAQLSPETLTPEETNLIQAYDNYIRLFPDGEYTPNFLASAGGIYYNHKKFAEAKVYFQTLVRRFPGAKEKSLAMRSIMDSYFALGKFKDSEIIAKRILADENLPEEQRTFAKRRLAEAIFKNAEFLAEQGDFFSSANEFLRLYEEVPDDKRYVEPALWNAGVNFQKARDWIRSNETFDVLATNFPESKFTLDALNNMVDNYKEMEQFANAAQTSERIFEQFPEDENAEAKLYNASYFYQKAEDWQEAIRVNNMYIARYPDLNFSVDLFFKNAELYLKLDNIVEANRIYEEFAQRHPNDERVIEAYYERGNYFLDNGQKEAAKSEFNKAIAKSEEFKSQGMESNPFIAGEAVNKLADILHEEFVAIELKQPQSNIDQKQQRLRGLLTELNTAYSKVLTFGSPRSFQATYNIARSYEEFADIYANQEVDPNLDVNKQFVKRKQINEQSAALYDNAVEQFKEVVDKIPVIADKLGVDMFGEESIDTVQVQETDTLAVADEIREAEPDSTRDLALKFYNRAKDKISELLYVQASITSENVDNALLVQAPTNDPLGALLYTSSVYAQVVAPAVEQTIQAHINNIDKGEELGLSNKYIEESKRQILLTSNILAQEYESLSRKALDQYETFSSEFEGLIEQEFGTLNSRGLDYYGVEQNAAQMIDECFNLASSAITAYSNTLTLAQENNIKGDLTRSTEEKVIRFAVEISERMKNLSNQANSKSQLYQVKFDSTQNYNYQDGTAAMDNFYFTLSDNSLLVLENAFDLKNQYELKGIWVNKLVLILIDIDPARYAGSIEKEMVTVYSDESWKYTNEYNGDWVFPDFDDSNWNNAQILFSAVNQFSQLGENPDAIWKRVSSQPVSDTTQSVLDTTFSNADTLSAPNSTISDTSFALSDTNLSVPNEPASLDSLLFFRKNLVLDGKIVSGKIYVTADEDYRLYINGEYIIDDPDNDFFILDTLDFYTFDRFIKEGRNVIAVDVMDRDYTGGGLKLFGNFELLPSDVISSAESELGDQQVFINPEALKKLNILRKNRIPLRQ